MFVYFEKLPTSPGLGALDDRGANPQAGSAIKGEVRLGGQFDGMFDRFGVGSDARKFDLPMLGSIWFGFWNYDQGKAVTANHFETWIDEIALDGARIGCTR